MGLFRRFMGGLFAGPPTKPEDIVFEPIDGPAPAMPPTPRRALTTPSASNAPSPPSIPKTLTAPSMENPPANEAEIPAESFLEAEQERGTFSDWEDELQASKKTASEARETMKALRGVRLPRTEDTTAFDTVLEQNSQSKALSISNSQTDRNASPPNNSRLRRILEAYAGSSTTTQSSLPAPAKETPPAMARSEPSPRSRVIESSNANPTSNWTPIAVATLATNRPQSPATAGANPYSSDDIGTQSLMRFEELGLSLSRFSEVRGFALWLGQDAMQTGELGFDPRGGLIRARLEKMLETATLGRGPQDGFLSVTVHQATGGISIFGGGPCLVAVAHQAEGMPAHLRAWLCGWVSQPLRG
jgi:hypothetical protein